MEQTYLGDSVYAAVEDGMIKLTTENGLPSDPSNTIYLDPQVCDALARYIESFKSHYAREAEKALAEMKRRHAAA
jgi:hypothetical protein